MNHLFHPYHPEAILSHQAPSDRQAPETIAEAAGTEAKVSPESARRILISLMLPTLLMPMVSTMSRVALPVIRDDFGIPADVTAWVAAVFTLPFMILMPVYGRLSDGLDKRRLILAGIVIFSIGTTITLFAPDMTWLMVGRAVQGIGSAGMMPLGMALISSIFQAHERGKALGTWSTIGPTAGFLGPLAAGFLVSAWGWRGAFAPPLVFGLAAFFTVHRGVPAGLTRTAPRFLRSFDWTGALLLAASLTGLIFFLSSRSITGVAPLHDWRLLSTSLVLLGSFWWWEKRRRHPFISLGILANRKFLRASFCASMRMFGMGGLSILIPLYLVDIHGIPPAQLGGLLMINAGAMALMVRFGGGASDRWSSRWPVVIGLAVQASVMVIFSQLPDRAPLMLVASTLAFHGLGVGLMLAALHRSVMGSISDAQMGAAAGLYSMFRFLGSVIGTALSGVILQAGLDAALPTIAAYQNVFLVLTAFPILGAAAAFGLRE